MASRAKGSDTTKQYQRDPSELFVRYASQLCRLAEAHLCQRLKSRVGGSDVVQSVFRTFFERVDRGEFRFDDSSQIWRMLVTITIRKVREVGRFHTRELRDARKEIAPDEDSDFDQAISREPSEDDALALADEVERILEGLSPFHAQVLELRLASYTPTEIAAQSGKSRQSVYRILETLQNRMLRDNNEKTRD